MMIALNKYLDLLRSIILSPGTYGGLMNKNGRLVSLNLRIVNLQTLRKRRALIIYLF
jgi:hypothetical protein